MVKSVIETRAHVDTRGLPESYDPHMFYEYAIDRALRDSDGIEWLVCRLMPRSIMRSFAFAIDPFSGLRTSATRITPVTRTRTSSRVSVLDKRNQTGYNKVVSEATTPNYGGVGVHSPFLTMSTLTFDQSRILADQARLPRRSQDTTRRTRIIGSEMGEFFRQEYSLSVPSRTISNSSITRIEYEKQPAAPGGNQRSFSTVNRLRTLSSAASFRLASYDLLRTNEAAYASTLLTRNALKLFNRALPDRREYSLFRNVVELRDLPRMILQARSTLIDLYRLVQSIPSDAVRKKVMNLKAVASDVPSEYLSFHFGWKQTYSDVMDLLQAPDRITKRINHLIRLGEKESVCRATMKLSCDTPSYSITGFDWDFTDLDQNSKVLTNFTRSAEARLALNVGFRFPDLMSPNFSQNLFLRKLGVFPSILDVYNLTPWTWLVDWFTGLGDYVDTIERINEDNKLINWGLATVVLQSSFRSTFSVESSSSDYHEYHTASGQTQILRNITTKSRYTLDSEFVLETQVRKDLTTTLSGVGTTADEKTLSSFQRSILGALLLQRSDILRRR